MLNIKLTGKQKKQLKGFWESLLYNFKYITDANKLGVVELWEPIPEDFLLGDTITGDCEEIARTACEELRKLDFRARLIYCLTENKAGHLVCEIEGWIMDNRYKRLTSVNKLNAKGYQLIAVSGYKAGEPWHIIK